MSLVSFPMYDLPEVAAHTRALWRAIAARLPLGLAAGAELVRPGDLAAHWREPSLLLSQSCGYPLLSLPDTVRVVATPVYDAPGCDGPDYSSAVVVRATDPARTLAECRDRICALNNRDSNSGMNLLRAAVAPLARQGRFFAAIRDTGSHAASLDAVASGSADLAAIDCVTLALLRRHRPSVVQGLRVLCCTEQTPGLPLISAGEPDTVRALRFALDRVAVDPELAAVRQALLIKRFVVLPDNAYQAIRSLEENARAAGYPLLA